MNKIIYFISAILLFASFYGCSENTTNNINVEIYHPANYDETRNSKMIISVGNPNFWLSESSRELHTIETKEYDYGKAKGELPDIPSGEVQFLFEIKDIQEKTVSRGISPVINNTGDDQTRYTMIAPVNTIYKAVDITGNAKQLNEGRYGHTLTKLPNGKILIWGGFKTDGNTTLNQNILYDPELNTFETLSFAIPPQARAFHTATLFYMDPDKKENPKVLIAGGKGDGVVYLGSAEVYDVNSKTFVTLPGGLTQTRANSGSAFLKIGFIFIIGGQNQDGYLNSVEIFNTFNNSFVSYPIPEGVANMSVTSIGNNQVVYAGGNNSSGISKRVIKLNNASIDTPVDIGNLYAGRSQHQAVLVNNEIFFIGGFSEFTGGQLKTPLSSIEKLVLSNETIQKNQNSLTIPRGDFSAVLVDNNNIAVIGGKDSSGNGIDQVEVLRHQNGSYSVFEPLPSKSDLKRYGQQAVLSDTGQVIIVGGRNTDGAVAIIECFNMPVME